MPDIGKNEAYPGFIPNHNHGSVNYTSVDDGHVHQYLFVTSPAIQGQGGGHVHYYDVYTTVDDGHKHQIKGFNQPAPGY
ncbi:MAG TPA: hypothetical protein DDY49_07360 [Paenibacillaceae bacterium]|nr:hypothetical protein [Paenibacillaceae bacterium]